MRKDETFTDTSVVIEDDEYVDCTFTRCHLYYSGGLIRMTNCRFLAPILVLQGPALRTVQFLEMHGNRVVAQAGELLRFESTDDPSST